MRNQEGNANETRLGFAIIGAAFLIGYVSGGVGDRLKGMGYKDILPGQGKEVFYFTENGNKAYTVINGKSVENYVNSAQSRLEQLENQNNPQE